MATKKKLLQAAAGSAGGAGPLNVEDVFSTYVYEGNGDTQAIENGINLGQSNYGKSIYFPDGDGDYLATASLPEFTGAFTFEFWFFSYDTDRALYLIDKSDRDGNFSITTNYLTSNDQIFVRVAGTTQNQSSVGFDPDGWNHVAVVRDSSNNLSTFVNGTRVANNSGVSGSITAAPYYIGSSSAGTSASGYELMYGHMSSVRISDNERYSTSSTSITVPTSEFTSDSNTVLLLGQGDTPLADASSNSYSITVNGNPRASEVGPYTADDAGEGGLVWFKDRLTTRDHMLNDTERGADKSLSTNRTGTAFLNYGAVTSFNSNGFSIGAESAVNASGTDLVSWTFRKAPKFFDVQTFTSASSGNTTFNHDLGATPACVIIKNTQTSDPWTIYHVGTGNDKYLAFDTSAAGTLSGSFSVNSTSVTVSSSLMYTSQSYVAYLFAHNDGDGEFGPDGDADIIKCGSFTEVNGSDVTVDLGFEPQWIMIKASSATGGWGMYDVMRGWTSGSDDFALTANTSDAESNVGDRWLINPNGFTWKDTTNSRDIIYIAIRRGPMAVPTDATDVFGMDFATSSGAWTALSGFPIDFILYSNTTSGSDKYAFSRLNSPNYMKTNNTSAETGYTVNFDRMDGIEFPTTTGDYSTWINWMWKRAPSFCDVVTYTGTGANRTVSHNLGVAPEMFWVKRRNSTGGSWGVYHKDVGNNKALVIDQTGASFNANWWNSTTPTDSLFYIGGDESTVNASGDNYIAYLFASLDGVSKVGSYAGNGSSQNIDCGFSSGARFVLIKSIQSGSWYVFDTERGIVAGNDSHLKLNTDDAEAYADSIDPYSSGFTVVQNGTTDLNKGPNDETYIFYAIA